MKMIYAIQSRLMGGSDVAYDCPGCGESLISPLTDAGQEDECPHCQHGFTVPGERELAGREQHRAEKAEKARQWKEAKARVQARRAQRKAEERAATPQPTHVRTKRGPTNVGDLVLFWFLSLAMGLIAVPLTPFLLIWVPWMFFVTIACAAIIVKRVVFG